MGILDRVTKASEAGEEYVKALIWGPNGSGKSTICGTAPRPILYAFTERQGLIAFKRMAPEEQTLKINSLSDLRSLLTDLRNEKHPYKSVCLDSFTEMQQLIIEEIEARKRTAPDEPVNLSIEERMFIHDRSKSLARAFRDLPMHVILTCLSESDVVGDGDNSRVVTKLMLSGRKLPAQMGQFFNLVGFMYKASNKDGNTVHRVAFDGRSDLDIKGMPGLRRREDPDIEYWYQRAIKNKKARDAEAPMIQDVSRGVDYEPEAKPKPEPKKKEQEAKKKEK